MPTLYGVYRSRAARNIWLALEMGIEMEVVPVIQGYRLPDPHASGAPLNTQSPDFLAMSPAGAVPILRDGDLVISESVAINLYLARKYGGPLAPADLEEEAQVLQWAFYGMTAVEPAALALMQAVMASPADVAGADAAAAKLARPLAVLQAHLSAHPYMVGDRFTVADVNTAEVVRYARARPGLIDAYPAVDAWLKACQARPAFQAMWAKREAEPA